MIIFTVNMAYSQNNENELVNIIPLPPFPDLEKITKFNNSDKHISNYELVKPSIIVMYQQLPVTNERVNSNDLSNYISSIIKCYDDYLLSKEYINEPSAFIIFAISTNNRAIIWLEDNYSNSNNVELNNLFMNISLPVVNSDSVTVAIHIGNVNELNELNAKLDYDTGLPNEWLEIARNNNLHYETVEDVININLGR
jgi:hypothetical protein